nr:MAG TPA: hypothetical protein [Caudoviricetes sp.]
MLYYNFSVYRETVSLDDNQKGFHELGALFYVQYLQFLHMKIFICAEIA